MDDYQDQDLQNLEARRQAAFQVCLAHLMEAYGYSQYRLARDTGENVGTISRLMRDSHSLREPRILYKIIAIMGCTRQEAEDLLSLAKFAAPGQIEAAIKRTTEHKIPCVHPPQDELPRTDELPPVPPALMRRFQGA